MTNYVSNSGEATGADGDREDERGVQDYFSLDVIGGVDENQDHGDGGSSPSILAWRDGRVQRCTTGSLRLDGVSIMIPLNFSEYLTTKILVTCQEDPVGCLSPEINLTNKTRVSEVFRWYHSKVYGGRGNLPPGADILMKIDRDTKTLGMCYSMTDAERFGITVEDTDWMEGMPQERHFQRWIVSKDRIPSDRYRIMSLFNGLSLSQDKNIANGAGLGTSRAE